MDGEKRDDIGRNIKRVGPSVKTILRATVRIAIRVRGRPVRVVRPLSAPYLLTSACVDAGVPGRLLTDDSSRSTYSEKETALILKRAAELEAAVGRGGRRLSLAEIQEIAGEAGIDPAVVADAARTVALTVPRTGGVRLFGASPYVRFERDLATRLAPDALQDVLSIVRRETGKEGAALEVLGGFEWQHRSGDEAVNVRVTPLGAHTRIEVLGRHEDTAVVTYAAVGVITVMVGVVIGTSGGALGPLDVAGLVATAYLSGRLAWNGIARGIRRRLERVFESVASRLVRDEPDSLPASVRADAKGLDEAG